MAELIEVKDVIKDFGGLRAVNNFSLDIKSGEIVGLIGPNGAGKTTVFNLITGIFPVTSGSISFQGQDLAKMPPYMIAQRGIARTFQNIRIFQDMTVLDNIRAVFHPRIRYNLLDALMHDPRYNRDEVRITEIAVELLETMNLYDRWNVKAGSLPYGDQRRLEIARALALEPSLLLLDEPAAGMNPFEVAKLVDLIKFVKEKFNLTVLLIEHQMGLVMNTCERLVVMDFGQVIARGLPEEIRTNPLVLEAYLGKGAAAGL
ncbi:MAG: ABC transporter ATP-binding protein [Methylocystaceae bacterium]